MPPVIVDNLIIIVKVYHFIGIFLNIGSTYNYVCDLSSVRGRFGKKTSLNIKDMRQKHVPHVRRTCTYHIICATYRTTCAWHLPVPHARDFCTCHMHVPHARATCTCHMHVEHVRTTCTYPMHVEQARRTCTDHVRVPLARATCTGLLHMPHACATSTAPKIRLHRRWEDKRSITQQCRKTCVDY